MNNKKFESNEFAIQIIAKGAFIDTPSGYDESFLVETTIIRMNPTALNEWILSETFNCRDCYDTDEEWEAHKAKYEQRQAVRFKIIEFLGIDAEKGNVSITQSQSEVFTVVNICKH